MNWIEIFFFTASFGFYLYNPIFQNVMFENFCVYRHNGVVEECRKNKTLNAAVLKDLSHYKAMKNWLLTLTTFISPMLVNFLSTRFYPERIVLLPTIHYVVLMSIGVLYSLFPHLNLYYFIIVYVIVDIFGLSSTIRSLVSFYLVKTCSEENVQSRLVIAESAFILSLAFSGLVKGYVEVGVGSLYSGVICLAIVVAAYLFTFTLERSMIKEKTSPITLASLKQSAKDAFKAMKKYPIPFITITITQFLYPMCEVGALKLVISYSFLPQFNVNKIDQGHILFLLSILRGIGSLIIIPVLLKYFKFRHWLLCVVFLPVQLGFYLFYGFARSVRDLYIGPVFFIFQDIYQPLFCYVVSKMFNGQSQAILIAFHFGLGAFSKRLGGAIGQAIFKSTLETMPGFVFLFFGAICFLTSGLGTFGSYMYLKAEETHPAAIKEEQE